MAAETNFPWLISNVIDKATARPLAEGLEYRMMDFHGRKVGLVGLVEQEWLVTLATIEPEQVEFEDFCACARRLSRVLRERGAEIVVALTHMRVPNDERLARECPEVDVILGGHDHHYEVKPVGPHDTYVLKSGTDFRDITELTLEFIEGEGGLRRHSKVALGGPKPFKVLGTRHVEIDASVAEEPEMKAYVEQCMSTVGSAMDAEIGAIGTDLDCRFASIRTMETNVGNLVTDIMRVALSCDVAFLNSGTLRADSLVEKGTFKMRDLVSLLPMLDELCLLELSGAQLLLALENAVSQYPRLEGRFAQVSGVQLSFDAAQPGGARVVEGSVTVAGAPLDLARTYTLCTKDYLRAGKDGYDVFRDLKCLADGESAGILPSLVRQCFSEVSELNGPAVELAPGSARKFAFLGKRLNDRFCLCPEVEGRIVCLNPSTN